MRFAGGRSAAMNRNKILKQNLREEANRINKYKIPNEKTANNSLDEIRIDISN